MEHSILLANGRYYDFAEPSGDVLTIQMIAHALSNICRYTGHTRRFYSVAEHSVRASLICEPDFALEVLMHDAAEAVVSDMSTPFKALVGENYRKHERAAEGLIATRWGLRHLWDGPYGEAVRAADLVMLATEKRDLLPPDDRRWPVLDGVEPLSEHIPADPEAGTPWLWKERFIERFVEICRDR